jgi:hypothetical protein
MFQDLADQTSVVTIQGNESDLLNSLENKLPEVETLHAERIAQLAKRYAKTAKAQSPKESGES